MPPTFTEVRRRSPRSPGSSGTTAKIRSARTNFPYPSGIMRGSRLVAGMGSLAAATGSPPSDALEADDAPVDALAHESVRGEEVHMPDDLREGEVGLRDGDASPQG